ncbi:MAG: CysB family HTH-type transcriptional regulator [Burkholderiaceae bacterium]
MNFNQLRFVRETVRRGFNLTLAAEALHTSQPGVSKAIIEFEDELGFPIFVRRGRRLTSLTEPGRAVLPIIERLLLEAENLKRTGQDFAAQEHGNLTIATTHTQARYTLPKIVQAFRAAHPSVHLSLLQGSPPQLAEMVMRDQADIAIATEVIADVDGLVSLPCFTWKHVAVVPANHALLVQVGDKPLSLDQLASYPLVTYDAAFAGRTRIDEAFALRHLAPDIVLAAIDADVIKTYVEAGLGVGLVADIAYAAERDPGLVAIPAGHLFGSQVTHLAFKRGATLRTFVHHFIRLIAPEFDPEMIDRLVRGEGHDVGGDYQL